MALSHRTIYNKLVSEYVGTISEFVQGNILMIEHLL
jgi:hypothetical protein